MHSHLTLTKLMTNSCACWHVESFDIIGSKRLDRDFAKRQISLVFELGIKLPPTIIFKLSGIGYAWSKVVKYE